MLRIKNLNVSYKTGTKTYPVIQNLSLEIGKGEAFTILGPSGCGKSTLINALAGVIPTDGGSMDISGEGGSAPLSPKAHKIAVIPQSLGLLPWKTVRENCLLPLKIRHERITPDRQSEIEDIYSSLDIAHLLERYPRRISGGQAQRAAIARAFIQKPDLLLMDEPFSSLDAITREDARELFLKLWREYSPTTVFVTHSIDEALYLGQRVAVMDSRMGGMKYQSINPYFGQTSPDNPDYTALKRLLRDMLRTDGKEGSDETADNEL